MYIQFLHIVGLSPEWLAMRLRSALTKRSGAARRDGCLFHTAEDTSFSIFIWLFDDWTNFWPLWKPKKCHMHLPGLLFPKNNFWLSRFWNSSTEDLWMRFSEYLIENVALLFQGFWLISSLSENSHADPAILIHPISKTILFLGPHAVLRAQSWIG